MLFSLVPLAAVVFSFVVVIVVVVAAALVLVLVLLLFPGADAASSIPRVSVSIHSASHTRWNT